MALGLCPIESNCVFDDKTPVSCIKKECNNCMENF